MNIFEIILLTLSIISSLGIIALILILEIMSRRDAKRNLDLKRLETLIQQGRIREI